MKGHSNTGAVVGVQVPTLAIYDAVTNVIVGCTSPRSPVTPHDSSASANFGLVG